MLAKLAHRAEHRDAAFDVTLGAETLQGRRHRGRIGVVAFVDEQHFTAVDLEPVTLAAALEPAHVGERKPGHRNVGAHRFYRSKHRERVRYPMLAALGDGEG